MIGETQVTVVGNLTDNPELRFTPGGVAVAKFSVAVNRRLHDKSTGEWRDGDPDFHRVTVWRGLAEHVAESLEKGTRVVVVGDLRQSNWQDASTGEKRSGWEIQASAVGPELTWATAKVARVAKGTGAAPDDPWNTAQRGRPTAPAVAGPAGGSDEPPF